jgi:hypothetical protein
MSQIADVLERFRRGGELLSTVTLGCAGQEADFQPGEDKWSVRMIVCHLADSELVTGMRLRLLIAEENPVLGPYDEKAWAKNLDYTKRKISQAIETFRRVRAENYELLKDLPESAYERPGRHMERGIETLGDTVLRTAEHVEAHVRQIQTVRAAYKEHKAKTAAAAPPPSQ